MSKKTRKGVTMPLTNFLATEAKLITVRESSWAAIVDEEDAKKSIVVDMSALPTAPRLSTQIDLNSLPTEPPFVARIENLSFEADEEQLRRIFADLNPIATKVLRDGNRSRGIGLVELPGREQLLGALKRTEKELFGRKIRVVVSKLTDLNPKDYQRNNFGSRSSRTGDERPEMADRWKHGGRRSDETFDDRTQRNDFRKPKQSANDYGYGYSRAKDNQYKDNRNRNTSTEESNEPVKERPRLHLQPRTKPLDETQTVSDSSSSINQTSPHIDDSPNNADETQQNPLHDVSDAASGIESTKNTSIPPTRRANASIFGGAKPVDTAARELEIEKKLKDLQLSSNDQEENVQSLKPHYNRDDYRSKRSNYTDNQSLHTNDYSQKQEYHSTRRYENTNRKSQYNQSSRNKYDNEYHEKSNRDNYCNRQVNNQRQTSEEDFVTESQTKNPPRNILRRTVQTEDNSNKLQLSNKFGMLDDDNDVKMSPDEN